MPKTTVERTDHSYVDAHGVTIHYYVWKAPKPKAVVQLAHGLGDHALRYDHVAQALAQTGYSVYADDHRGHGETGVTQHAGDKSRLGRLGPGGVSRVPAGGPRGAPPGRLRRLPRRGDV